MLTGVLGFQAQLPDEGIVGAQVELRQGASPAGVQSGRNGEMHLHIYSLPHWSAGGCRPAT
jgi:hypothetical protein